MSDPIERLSPLRDVIAAHDLRAEKSLGQNFLLDLNITDKIVRACPDLSDVTIFEIGPGPGGLTRSLLKAGAKKVVAVEFDGRAVSALQDLKEAACGRLEIVHGDALKIDLLALAEGKRAIVSNLPYNIATPLLIGWLKQIRADKSAFEWMVLMFQKEVAHRIAAQLGSKAYGRLAVISQWLTRPDIVYNLPPQAFTPAPKVESSVVRFLRRDLEGAQPLFEDVGAVTAAAFGQRRKMIRSSLKAYLSAIEALGIAPTLRAENLEPADYLALAHQFANKIG